MDIDSIKPNRDCAKICDMRWGEGVRNLLLALKLERIHLPKKPNKKAYMSVNVKEAVKVAEAVKVLSESSLVMGMLVVFDSTGGGDVGSTYVSVRSGSEEDFCGELDSFLDGVDIGDEDACDCEEVDVGLN